MDSHLKLCNFMENISFSPRDFFKMKQTDENVENFECIILCMYAFNFKDEGIHI